MSIRSLVGANNVMSTHIKTQIQAAITRSNHLASIDWNPQKFAAKPRTRWFAVGASNVTPRHFVETLAAAGLLVDNGQLAADVGLVMLSGLFDFVAERDAVYEVTGLVRWLLEHAPDQVVIVTGNVDLSRVMEYEPDRKSVV